ncbi:UNVERIFIED_CONTAM: hypothetical protein RMT77_002264 [Armadillidium vulgare]
MKQYQSSKNTNIKCRYETKHSQHYSKFTKRLCVEKYESLKRGLKYQPLLFTKVNAKQEAATCASFRVAHSIAKHGKVFTNYELIKDCMIAAAEEICPERN